MFLSTNIMLIQRIYLVSIMSNIILLEKYHLVSILQASNKRTGSTSSEKVSLRHTLKIKENIENCNF